MIATKGLQKLGYALDAIATSGTIADLEAKMREHKWTTIRANWSKDGAGADRRYFLNTNPAAAAAR